MASVNGRVVRLEETEQERTLRIAKKAVEQVEYALNRAIVAEERATTQRKQLEEDLTKVKAELEELEGVE